MPRITWEDIDAADGRVFNRAVDPEPHIDLGLYFANVRAKAPNVTEGPSWIEWDQVTIREGEPDELRWRTRLTVGGAK